MRNHLNHRALVGLTFLCLLGAGPAEGQPSGEIRLHAPTVNRSTVLKKWSNATKKTPIELRSLAVESRTLMKELGIVRFTSLADLLHW